MTQRPLVSIVVPSYNQGRFIRETIESIVSQDYRPLEVLVIDGGSTDGTLDLLRDIGAQHSELRWWSEPDDGVATAVNRGLGRAGGVYAGIQSSDDLYRPGAITEAVAALEADPGVGLVCGDAEIIDVGGQVETIAPCRLPITPQRVLARTTVIHQSSTFFRLALARQLGGWDGSYFCCDTEFWLRMLAISRAGRAARVWSAWRKHDDQRDKAGVMFEEWARMTRSTTAVRGAPLNVRLAAAAGRRLMAVDYPPVGCAGVQRSQIAVALLIYPPSMLGVPPALLPRPIAAIAWRARARDGVLTWP